MKQTFFFQRTVKNAIFSTITTEKMSPKLTTSYRTKIWKLKGNLITLPTHDPVMALLPVNLTVTNIQNNLPLKTCVYWDKVDKQLYMYAKDVAVELDEYKCKLSNLSCENAADIIQEICTIIHQCAMKNCRRKVKPWHKRRHCKTPEIRMALKHSKEKFWHWKNAGKNKNSNCTIYIELKKSKKILRSLYKEKKWQNRDRKNKKK